MTSRPAEFIGAALCRGFIVTGALVAALTLHAQQAADRKGHEHAASSGDTASCIKECAEMNMASIKFGQLASQKASNPELKQFGQQLQRDHQKAQDKLAKIAKHHDVTLPTSLDAKCQEEMSRLQALTGDEFDKEFAKGAVQGHAMAVAKAQKGSVEAKDSDLAQYSKEMLPELKRHQEKAREIAKAVGLDQTTIAALETQPPDSVGTAGSQIERGASSSKSEKQTEQKDSDKKALP
jgi:putative membrane protein